MAALSALTRSTPADASSLVVASRARLDQQRRVATPNPLRSQPTRAAASSTSLPWTKSSRSSLSMAQRRRRGIRPSATGGNPFSSSSSSSSSSSPLSSSTSSLPLEPGTVIAQLPIFPLNMVAFPHADVPLHIFEARYRVLFSTLLQGDDGIDEGLVSAEKPWAGTRSFGLSWSDGAGGVAGVGTRLSIKRHATLPDGRLFVESVGVERFRIKSVVQTSPIVVAEVEILPELLDDASGKAGDDDDDVERRNRNKGGGGGNEDGDDDGGERDSKDAATLAGEVADAFRALIALNLKMGVIKRSDLADKWKASVSPSSASVDGGKNDDEEAPLEPPELSTLGPAALSHWVSAFFNDSPTMQQVLLQEDSVPKRLRSLLDVLEGTVKFFRAKAAIEAVSGGSGGSSSSSSSDSDSPSPPPGGPD